MAPEDRSRYPLYNTTFSLHRLSPLYTGSDAPLDNAILRQHAKRFRDILAGEVLRGVRVGLSKEDDVLARVGALLTVTWRLLPEEEAWTGEEDPSSDDATMTWALCRGTIFTVTYEKMVYKAIMMRNERGDYPDASMVTVREEMDGFQSFPLLLVKMPGSLREAFTSFLATTFDIRISLLHLSSMYLTDTFERYLEDISMGEDGELLDLIERSRTLRNIIKEILVVVGFDIPGGSAALKTIEINIDREDVPRMLARGKAIDRHTERESPFFDALTSYIQGHLALDLQNDKVKIVRIACGAFVLGSEGKIKLTQSSNDNDGDASRSAATRRLINSLTDAAGGGLLAAG
ncbi:hypothetical protein QTJ16_007077 [Diplocarpon rosae]|uniref:Uncharacterized protein n=1 Tax=Diplocarpon rosae TaxID=946125 RepID=A0AAD9WAT2_9HELO|nr:hypothetical protein QTJ16_007077 [Diplocarpon rosae]PBP21170.1 siroheme synthase [Diplocarpon rosae]